MAFFLIPVSSLPSIRSAPRTQWPQPVVRWLRRLRWAASGLLLLAAVAWLPRLPSGVPVDWAGFWNGDEASGLGGGIVPRLEGAQLVQVEGDAAYQSNGQAGLNEFVDLGGWQVGPMWTLSGWFRLESFPEGDAAWASLAGGMRNGSWCLEIRDDGMGFDPDTAAPHGGRGLRSFRERAAELGGTLTLETAPRLGTRIQITFPGPVPS